MHAQSIYGMRKPRRIRNELENRFLGRHFASHIASETLWGFLGALERMSECSQDALGTFQGRSWDVPCMLQSAIGTFLGRFWRLSGHLGAATEAHFSKIHSQFHCNVVLGPILEAPSMKNSDFV